MNASKLSRVVVGGSGTMGLGIAQVAAAGGLSTTMVDISDEALARARGRIEANLAKGVEKGKVTTEQRDPALANLRESSDLSAACQDADLLIEAIPEDVEMKFDFFRRAEAALPGTAVIASNTSALSITELASCLEDPGRMVGMHFFNPVHIMKLVETIRGLQTRDEAVAVARRCCEAMGKTMVEVNEAPGFVTTRVNALIGNEAFRMLQEGVSDAKGIDTALKLGLNHPMGPFELVDLVGLDTRLSILQYLHRTLGDRFRPTPLMEKYVRAGRLGRKAGRGVYDYEDGA